MAAQYSAASDASIAAEIVKVLEAATWESKDVPEEPAFDAVRVFDSTDILRAFEEVLVAAKNRLAFVVVGGATWDDESATVGRLVARRTKTVTLIVSDRCLGDRQSAVMGKGSLTPGCSGLKDVALAALAGSLATDPKTELRPISEDLLFVERLEDTAKTLPGRAAYLIEFAVRGGSIIANLTPGPRL